MIDKANVKAWLAAPPLDGLHALLLAIVAVAIPAFICVAVGGAMEGIDVVPFFPFMLLSAILLEWPYAAGVALGSAFSAKFLTMIPGYGILSVSCDILCISLFLISSALVLGLVHAARKLGADPLWLKRPDDSSSGIIFSLREGQAYVSWRDVKSPARLGDKTEVAEMMRDFIAQVEFGERLAAGPADVPFPASNHS